MTTTATVTAAPAAFWTRARTGHAVSGLPAAFLLFDAILHLLRPDAVGRAFTHLGYPTGLSRPFGALELLCLTLYLAPRTAPLGAVLLAGYLGGAVSAHARLQDPVLGTTLFPVYLGALLWVGLWLREPRVRKLFW